MTLAGIPNLTGDAADLVLEHKGHQLFVSDTAHLYNIPRTQPFIWELFCDDCNRSIATLNDDTTP